MDVNRINSIYFLGIGGIGMSALARYFLWCGKTVCGFDRQETPLTRVLVKEGVQIHYTESPSSIPAATDMVVYTPAIPVTNKEYVHLRSTKIPMYKRAEVLGMISRTVPTIAVAGTHGKTTVTTMLAHIFKVAGENFSAFMGGISVNYDTNFLGSVHPQWIIAEADEYDRSFLQLNPRIAIVTSMDADHLDIYGSADKLDESFRLFVKNIDSEGSLIVHNSLEKLSAMHPRQRDYGLSLPAHFGVENIELKSGKYHFDFVYDGQVYRFELGMAGRHNLENALAAAAAATEVGINPEIIGKALASYRGVKRRFEIHIQTPQLTYIDDYAHHPRELTACIESAREFFPGKKISGIFQPHLYSRTRDFADDFAQALDLLDEVILLDIYPARELPIEGVSSSMLLDKIKGTNKRLLDDDQLLDYIEKERFEVLLTMGAGNIDKYVEPIKEKLSR